VDIDPKIFFIPLYAIIIVIAIVVNAVNNRKAKKAIENPGSQNTTQDDRRFTVRWPGSRIGSGIVIAVLFCGGPLGTFLLAFDLIIEHYKSVQTLWDAVWPALLILVGFPLVFTFGLWFLLRTIAWKVQIDGSRIVITSSFGKKTEYSFRDITEIKVYEAQLGHAVNVYAGKKMIFTADQSCDNFILLVLRLVKAKESGEIKTSSL